MIWVASVQVSEPVRVQAEWSYFCCPFGCTCGRCSQASAQLGRWVTLIALLSLQLMHCNEISELQASPCLHRKRDSSFLA